MTTATHHITEAQVLGGYRLRLTFDDGLAGDVDLSYLRDWDGVFEPLHDPDAFARVHVDPEAGTVTWPEAGADLAPEVLYEQASAHRVR